MGWEYYPPPVGDGIRSAWKLIDGVPIIVTENGIATADDTRRIAYTTGALTAVHQALADGINVGGYLYWSALDHYEWGSFRPTFGLIAVDRHSFARTPKPSAYWLGEVAKTGRDPLLSESFGLRRPPACVGRLNGHRPMAIPSAVVARRRDVPDLSA